MKRAICAETGAPARAQSAPASGLTYVDSRGAERLQRTSELTTMPLPKDKAWFPARRYGWGWGTPSRWQGWAVMGGFVAALFAGAGLAAMNAAYYAGYAIALGGLLTAICYWKGEPPKWRWGDDDAE